MEEAEKNQLIKEYEKLIREFRSYKKLLETESLTKVQEGYMNSLQSTLQRKVGTYKGSIVELSGKQWTHELNYRFDFWAEALRSDRNIPRTLNSIGMCVQAINEAIGKLEEKTLTVQKREQVNLPRPPIVFIAHGGESPSLHKLKRYLLALGMTPLVVEEQPSRGRSIGENVDYYARKSDCAIILATKGDKDVKNGAFIPRGNVLIEIGKAQELFLNKIIYLLQAGTKFPSNISEKVWIRFVPQSMDEAFIRIAKELREFGLLPTFSYQKGVT